MYLKAQLIQFKTPDQLQLPGLLYEPQRKTKKVALVLHGMLSSIFYSAQEHNIFAEILNKKGIAYFPFNNRGSGFIQCFKIKEEWVPFGTTYETIKDCIIDIDTCVKYLWSRGYREFYLIGYSTGANKICVYNYYQPKNKITKYIIVGGGDDTGLHYNTIGNRAKFFKHLKTAKQKIKQKKGQELIPLPWGLFYLLSYKSFFDTCNPEGDYNIFPFNEYMNNLKLSKKEIFREFKSIKKPTLVIYGEKDACCYGDVPKVVKILQDQVKNKNNFDFTIIPGADHGIHGQEKELASLVAGWI